MCMNGKGSGVGVSWVDFNERWWDASGPGRGAQLALGRSACELLKKKKKHPLTTHAHSGVQTQTHTHTHNTHTCLLGLQTGEYLPQVVWAQPSPVLRAWVTYNLENTQISFILQNSKWFIIWKTHRLVLFYRFDSKWFIIWKHTD